MIWQGSPVLSCRGGIAPSRHGMRGRLVAPRRAQAVCARTSSSPLLSSFAFFEHLCYNLRVGLGTPVRRRETVRLPVPFQRSGRVPGKNPVPG
jgi:hypothetical protein